MDNRALMLRVALPRGFPGVAGKLNAPGRGAAPWLLGVIGAVGLLTAGGSATAWATCRCGKLPRFPGRPRE